MELRSRARAITGWWWEALCFLLYLALAGTQLFFTPVTGMADNGDFPKVLARFNACHPADADNRFRYIASMYRIDPDCYWDSGQISSETLLAQAIVSFAEWQESPTFWIDDAGTVHLFFVLLALWFLLWALHGAPAMVRFGLPPLALLIFSDVAYVSYLNSFYMDAASMVFLLLTVSLAVLAVVRRSVWAVIGFGIAGVAMACSKTQHALTGILFASMAAWFAIAGKRTLLRWAWAMSAIALASAALAIILMTSADYKVEPLYSLIFVHLGPESENPALTLNELGLPASDVAYLGTHAYSIDAPVANRQWRSEFAGQISYRKLMLYYVRHPAIPLGIFARELGMSVPHIRPGNLANYRIDDGFPPGTLARRFDWWTNLRAWSLRVFPAHIAVFYLAMAVGSSLCVRWPLAPVAATLAICGLVEFMVAVLMDGTETSRHLFLFHVITEVLIVFAVAAILSMRVEHMPRQHGLTPA